MMTLRLFSRKRFSAISDSHFLSFEWPMEAVLFLEFAGTEPVDTVISESISHRANSAAFPDTPSSLVLPVTYGFQQDI